MTVLLRASGIDVGYGARTVLSGIDLEVADGEVVAVLGPNGAGKSTLLRVLAGLAAPARGTVERTGRTAAALQGADLARRSVRADVELAQAWWGVPRAERRDRAAAALAAVRVEHLARRPARTLSGGERRRVQLACAVALRPDVLLLDEPFAGLDVGTRAALVEDTASVLRSAARAAVLVLHQRSEAWALATRLVVLLDGAVAAAGPPGEVLARPPSPAVARFLGYSGELRDGSDLLLARPSQVALDPDGAIEGTVVRRVPREDDVLVTARTATGSLQYLHPSPGPEPGVAVRLRLDAVARFPADPDSPRLGA